MNMTALFNRLDDTADIVTVLNYGVVKLQRRQCNFVPDGNGAKTFDFNGTVVFHDPTGNYLSPFDAFNNNDADGIGFIMNDEMRCSQKFLHST